MSLQGIFDPTVRAYFKNKYGGGGGEGESDIDLEKIYWNGGTIEFDTSFFDGFHSDAYMDSIYVKFPTPTRANGDIIGVGRINKITLGLMPNSPVLDRLAQYDGRTFERAELEYFEEEGYHLLEYWADEAFSILLVVDEDYPADYPWAKKGIYFINQCLYPKSIEFKPFSLD
jgi:hypothetical protein